MVYVVYMYVLCMLVHDLGGRCGISICITYTLMYCSVDSIVHAECVLTVYLYGCTCAHVQCAVYMCVVRSVHASLFYPKSVG